MQPEPLRKKPEKGPVKLMPDKNPDNGPDSMTPAPEELLRHTAPQGLKRWGKIAAIAAVIIAVAGVALRLWHDRQTTAWTDDQAVQTVQILKLDTAKKGADLTLPGDVQ